MVTVLFSLGNLLESMTMDRARDAIRDLMELAPPEATLLLDDIEKRVDISRLRVGDKILVRPGERIAIDYLRESSDHWGKSQHLTIPGTDWEFGRKKSDAAKRSHQKARSREKESPAASRPYKNIKRKTCRGGKYRELRPGDICSFEIGEGYFCKGTQALKVEIVTYGDSDKDEGLQYEDEQLSKADLDVGEKE